jgi:hypothetical protein
METFETDCEEQFADTLRLDNVNMFAQALVDLDRELAEALYNELEARLYTNIFISEESNSLQINR